MDSMQELLSSSFKLSAKVDVSCISKVRYLTQFFANLGGSIWFKDDTNGKNWDIQSVLTGESLKCKKRKDVQGDRQDMLIQTCIMYIHIQSTNMYIV